MSEARMGRAVASSGLCSPQTMVGKEIRFSERRAHPTFEQPGRAILD